MGSRLSMLDCNASAIPVFTLFVPVLPSISDIMEKVARRICQRERSSLHERALTLALVARFGFKVPKDVSCLLYRMVLCSESRNALAIRELEHTGENNESLRVLIAHQLKSERRKWIHVLDCISSIVFFVDAALFHTKQVFGCGCCEKDMIPFVLETCNSYCGKNMKQVSSLVVCLNREQFVENLKLGFHLGNIVMQYRPGDSIETVLLHVATHFRNSLGFAETNVIFCGASDNIAVLVRDYCLSRWEKKL